MFLTIWILCGFLALGICALEEYVSEGYISLTIRNAVILTGVAIVAGGLFLVIMIFFLLSGESKLFNKEITFRGKSND